MPAHFLVARKLLSSIYRQGPGTHRMDSSLEPPPHEVELLQLLQAVIQVMGVEEVVAGRHPGVGEGLTGGHPSEGVHDKQAGDEILGVGGKMGRREPAERDSGREGGSIHHTLLGGGGRRCVVSSSSSSLPL